MKTGGGANLWFPVAATGPVQLVKHASKLTSCRGDFPWVLCRPLLWLHFAPHHAVKRCEVVLDALRYNRNPAVRRRIISSVLREFRGFNGWLSVYQRAFMLTSVLIGPRPAAG